MVSLLYFGLLQLEMNAHLLNKPVLSYGDLFSKFFVPIGWNFFGKKVAKCRFFKRGISCLVFALIR